MKERRIVRQPNAAIVIRKDHDGVPVQPERPQRLQDLPHPAIHAFHHRHVVGSLRLGVSVTITTGSAGRLKRAVRSAIGNIDKERPRRIPINEVEGAARD